MSEIENLKIYGGATYTVGNQDIVANEWEASKTYVKGKSYVTYEHGLYVCNTTHTSVSPIDLTKWTAITVGEAIAANTTAIGDLSQLTTTDKSSAVGAINELNKVSRGTITASTGYSIVSQKLVKQGKTVMLNLVMTATTPIKSSRVTIANIPVGFRPQLNVNLTMGCSGQVNGLLNRFMTGLITVGGDIMVGDMILPAGETVKEFGISTCYEQYS